MPPREWELNTTLLWNKGYRGIEQPLEWSAALGGGSLMKGFTTSAFRHELRSSEANAWTVVTVPLSLRYRRKHWWHKKSSKWKAIKIMHSQVHNGSRCTIRPCRRSLRRRRRHTNRLLVVTEAPLFFFCTTMWVLNEFSTARRIPVSNSIRKRVQ